MITLIKKAAVQQRYLLLIAALLYLLSFVFPHYFTYNSSKEVSKILEKYITAQEEVFKEIVNNSTTVNALISDKNTEVKRQLIKEKLGIFTYQVNDIGNPIQIYWNNNTMSLDEADLRRADGNYIVTISQSNFLFIKKTFIRQQVKYWVCALIPVRWDYFIHNEYLLANFAASPNIRNTYEITSDPNATPVKNANGDVIFRIKQKHVTSGNVSSGALSIILRVAAFILLMIVFNTIALALLQTHGFYKSFFFLAGILFILRVITYYFPFLLSFQNLDLFSPQYYASSSLHPSLGDLLLNSMLLYWIIIYAKLNFKSSQNEELNLTPKASHILSILSLIALPFVTLQFAGLISSLVTDSKVSLDATNFFSLNFYTFVIFVIVALLVLSFFHLSDILSSLSSNSDISLIRRIFIIAITSLFWSLIKTAGLPQYVCLMVCLWLIVFILIVDYRKQASLLPFVNSSFFIVWSVFLIASVTALISYQNDFLESKTRIRIAESLDLQTDPAEEVYMNMAIANLTNEFVQNNFYKFYNTNTNRYIKDSLITQNFSGYLNKYDTRIYIFDSLNSPLFNEDSASYYDIKSIIENGGKTTGIPDLYYYENTSDRFSYLYERKVLSRDSLFLGTVIILLNPNIYKDAALMPELFKQVKDVTSDLNTNYAYAIYKNRHLIKNFNNYDFSDSIYQSQIPDFTYKFVRDKDVSQLWYHAGNNKIIIVVHKNNWFTYCIALFAYLFFLFIITASLLHFVQLLANTGLRRSRLKQILHLNIRSQIQLTIISVTVFSFVVIGVTTISFFILRFNKNTSEKITNTAQIIVNEIEQQIKSELVINDQFDINDIGINGNLERKIIEIAGIHNTDVNLYSKTGNLVVSSQPYIYNKQILSNKMQPDAFYSLYYNHNLNVIQKEYVGKFSYLSIYMPIRDEKGIAFAYLNIPYLNSQYELKQEISDFLVTLINLNALIFILAGAIAILLTSKITNSFEFIGNRMKQISLGKTNQQIEWTRKDEIGVLVKEYNKMVKKLEQSAAALARSEREEAWREMARQVAHEIKNPLTPMKLSMQYLQKAINNNVPNTKELAQQVSKTLIEQIDQLSKIADDFSQFANIGYVKPERFDITETISSLVTLYKTDSGIRINWQHEQGTLEIFSDKTQINRLFTNLIKNAIEASAEKEIVSIFINQYKENGSVIISLCDEGIGIDEAMQPKIFEPNFTTKSSGTGLGLAICKAIVEKANGKIWFQTSPGKGTTFYVDLPLAN